MSENKEEKVIKVLGTGCSSCKALYCTVQEAVKELGIDATVEKEEDLNHIIAYKVMSLPALVVDEKVVSKGKKLTVEQVKKLLS
ncbi:MAG: thioredoxin family protein [Bacteroidales bacterium]|nr:thioredoxin family protein [Bacteroidales bacterium]